MSEYLDLAVRLAKESGGVQIARLGDVHTIEYKDRINIVTEVDRECERLIVDGIRDRFSDHDVLGEEGEGVRKESAFRWIVDPLDGTTNYSHQFPFFGVSIALEHEGRMACGVIYDPIRDELFSAERGKGAWLNGKAIAVSKAARLEDALLATGFAYIDMDGERLENIDYFEAFIKHSLAVRRPGAATLDLAYVACGRLDGFWEPGLKPWDLAAGALIIEESGGKVTSFDGSEFDVYGTSVLASNSLVHDEMVEILKL